MQKILFNDNWSVGPKGSLFGSFFGGATKPEAVTLPHDAMIGQSRIKDGVAYEGFYPNGSFEYTKSWTVPEDYRDKTVRLEFEGVYMKAQVYVNGEYAGHYPFGYGEFSVCLDNFLKYGAENTVKVTCDTAHDHRWYSGQGIYRNVHLIVGSPCHIAQNGVQVTTVSLNDDGTALIEVMGKLENNAFKPCPVVFTVDIAEKGSASVAKGSTVVTAFPGETITRQRILVKNAKTWSPESPSLYTIKSKLESEGKEIDSDSSVFGIRTLTVDALHGLRLNGKSIKLKGGCIHHDNGIIGSATFEAAEERRARILKKAGYNAIRSAHNPISRAFLDACDKLGLLVMDEVADMWALNKNPDDFAQYFPDYWESIVEAMVAIDYNHPSVVLYSIGNEIPDVSKPNGTRWGRLLAEKLRSLDSTRPVMNSLNAMVAAQEVLMQMMSSMGDQEKSASDVNALDMGTIMGKVLEMPSVSESLEEAFGCVDIVGLNYSANAYESEGAKYPDRVLVGSEDFPKDLAYNWALTERLPYVLGDFSWTAWEYMGEAGVGAIRYGDAGGGIASTSNYPYLVSSSADVDLIGYRRPVSYWREIVWGKSGAPYIAVLKPEHYGEKATPSTWAWSDSESTWTWPGFEGKPIQVEVYSNADEVALFLDGKEIGGKAISCDGEKDKSNAF
jgi:beta-galactosidase